MKKLRDYCPCCGYPTLPLRDHPLMPTFDICFLCKWQDDGQSNADANKVYGGPNGSYSLTQARTNFKQYLVMYFPDDNIRKVSDDSLEEIEIKESLIKLFERNKISTSQGKSDEIWLEITKFEDKLHRITRQKNDQIYKK